MSITQTTRERGNFLLKGRDALVWQLSVAVTLSRDIEVGKFDLGADATSVLSEAVGRHIGFLYAATQKAETEEPKP